MFESVATELFKKKPLGYEMKPELEIYIDGFKDGYKKATEWHKQDIDDIYDLIAEDLSIRYFICIMKDKRRVTVIGNCDEGC